MLRKLIKISILAILLLALLIVGFIAAVSNNQFGHLYSKAELVEFKNEVASVIVASDGTPIGKVFTQNRTNVSHKELPKHLIDALVATEDARYFKHEGVDSRSLLRVLVKTVLMGDKSAGGGSTLSQQLAKNISGRSHNGKLGMLLNKTKEGIMAHRLEQVYSKEDILTLYLNTVPFGENIYGIEAAAQRFYNKQVKDLSINEAAVLVGLLKANTYYNPRLRPENALRRRNVVLAQMAKYDYLTQGEKTKLQAQPLDLNYLNLAAQGPANYFLQEVKSEAEQIFQALEKSTGKKWDLKKDGLVIQTTLDSKMQNMALNAFQEHLSVMQSKLNKQYQSGDGKAQLNLLAEKELKRLGLSSKANTKSKVEVFDWEGKKAEEITVKDSVIQSLLLLHAGFLALDPTTGAIKAYVGGIDYESQPYNQIRAQRSIASTIKPILAATALEEGATPCTYYKNEFETREEFPTWQPSNYDDEVGGLYSMQATLIKSKNLPAIDMYDQIVGDGFMNKWQQLGFSKDMIQVPSEALGSVTANIYEVATAYASFANNGLRVYPKTIISISTPDGKEIYRNPMHPASERVLSESNAQQINAMLQEVVNRGTGGAIKSKYGITASVAGKTGTAQSFTDAWFAAYLPNLVCVVRVGNSKNTVHFNNGYHGSGSALALPIVAKVLQDLQQNDYPLADFNYNVASDSTLFACDDFMEQLIIEEDIKPKKQNTKPKKKSTSSSKKKKKRRKRRKRR